MTGRLFRLAVALAMFTGLAAGSANAAETVRGASDGKVEYRIVHSKYDEIGSHSVSFSRNGGDLVVDVAINIEVKFLFIAVHSLVAERRETWRDGRFVGYKSHTDENSDLFDVSARAEGDKLIIEGPDGKVEEIDLTDQDIGWSKISSENGNELVMALAGKSASCSWTSRPTPIRAGGSWRPTARSGFPAAPR